MKQAVMDRLVYIKSIHRKGVEMSREQGQTQWISILLFHDSVELFLHLCADHHGGSDRYKLMKYYDEIQDVAGDKPEYEGAIKRLHRIRNNVKHQGTRPSEKDIDTLRVSVGEFFEANTQKFFDISYEDVSLSELIEFEDTKEQLQLAEQELEKKNVEGGIKHTAAAFDNMMDEFDKRSDYQLDYLPYPTIYPRPTGPDVEGESLFENVPRNTKLSDANGTEEEIATNLLKLEESINQNQDKIEHLYDILRIMSLDIDFTRYQRFNSLAPDVTSEGELRRANWSGSNLTEQDLEFAIQFVIDVALTLQDTDLDLDGPIQTSYASLDEF